MALDQDLLDILVCPQSKQALVYFSQGESGDDEASAFLFCPESGLRYRIDDGIPVMLVDEAEKLSEVQSERLATRARELGISPGRD
jgi:uncharacterized protein YbaR (Trm112 family)